MATVYLTDRQWAFIQPFLPPPAHTGRPRADDRKTVEGMLYVLTTGCRWPVPTVNEPKVPDSQSWRLLLQLNTKEDEADDPFFLNFADDGVGYAFISHDGHWGTFLWSR